MFTSRPDWQARWSRLQRRGFVLLLVFVCLLAASPTPVVRSVSDELRLLLGAQVSGRPAAMLQALGPILSLEPGDPVARLAAADAALHLHQPGLARDHLLAAGLGVDDSGFASCTLVRTEVADGTLDDIKDLADRLRQFCPADDPAWPALVTGALSSGQTEAASQAAGLWAQADPADPQAHYLLGLALALDNPPAALAPLKTAQALSPEALPVAASLAQAVEDALPSADRAYQLAQVGQSLARQGRWELAAIAFTRAVDLAPDYVEAEAYLGLVLDRTGGDGEKLLLRASQAVPSASLPHVFLAQHWAGQGELQRAADELRTAQSLEPDSPAIAAQLGSVLASLGDLQSALTAYQQAVELAPASADFESLLAGFSLDHEIDVSGVGLHAARQAVLLDRSSPSHLDQLGFAYYLAGNPEMGEHVLLLALQADPTRAATNYHLGLARLAVGKTDLAVVSLKMAASLDPGGMYAMLATRTLSRLQTP